MLCTSKETTRLIRDEEKGEAVEMGKRDIYIDRKTRLSMTSVHRTVQEGLSMVSFRECITKSKHVF